ncbi:hypothetical protein [Trinickia sp.]|uniref:hypothetical protein n=1 Tax=Trinickia sp. TaxID=2571163 RepID=UPI003F7F104D
MKDENGQGVIRFHDKTTHGGEIVTAYDGVWVRRSKSGKGHERYHSLNNEMNAFNSAMGEAQPFFSFSSVIAPFAVPLIALVQMSTMNRVRFYADHCQVQRSSVPYANIVRVDRGRLR